MRVLIAPDKFRGTLTASEAAAAMAAGWGRARPQDQVDMVPLADGGEGTLDALVDALGGRRLVASVTGPLGDPVQAEFGMVEAAGETGRTAIVEMARASGLHLVPGDRRDPTITTSRGPGMRLLDAAGRDLGPGGAALAALERIDARGLEESVRGIRFVVAGDVDNPLVGPQGASTVYGPQKGASPRDVVLLDAALGHYAEIVRRDVGVEVRDRPGAGAAGGLGAGLMAFLGAEMRQGVQVVMEAVGFAGRLARADLVITGEGKLDRQSLHGKTPGGVLTAARASGTPVLILCGQADVHPEGVAVSSLVEAVGRARAFGETRQALEDLAADVAPSAARLAGTST